ncbi:MAG: ketoacyl-ACP synthase III [Desulfovibrionaceae bacterium]|nr:ketoacyl-ACP synthase III [Desulfovibrionaceae bacterium]
MFHTLRHVRIVGIRSAVPTTEIRLEDEGAFYGGDAKKVTRLRTTLGMDRRRICPPDVTASDLCAHAADALLRVFPSARSAIDAVVFVSQATDWVQPATSCELQHRLGLDRQCAAFDVNQGCSGYVYGLWLGSSLIAAGAARQVLLLVGDVNLAGRDIRNRITVPVFGDGGSATLLARDEQAGPMHFGLGTDGRDFDAIITPGGGARIPLVPDPADNESMFEDILDPSGNPWRLLKTYMDGGAIFNFTMDVVPKHIRAALAYASLTEKDIDWLILHQANRQIVESIAAKTGFALEKAPSASFGTYGNLASASIPVALCDTFGNTRQAPGKVLLCGYGIGLSWGSCLCDIAEWDCAPPLDYEPDPDRPTRRQHIERWEQILRGERTRHD